MGRIRVEGSSGEFVKWSQVERGHVFEGVYGGQREGKFGLLADLETAKGPLVLPVPAALQRQLGRVRIGGFVAIEYGGLQVSKAGREFHHFVVFVDHANDLLPAPARRGGD